MSSTLSQTELPLSIESRYFIHQMFPFDPALKKHKDLQVGLKQYQFLLNISLEAIKQYNERHLERFDALVGENACQIRAVRIAIMAKGDVDLSSLEDCIIETLSSINVLLQPSKIIGLMKKGISLLGLLQEEDLSIALSNDEAFLIQAFILTEAMEVFIDEGSNSPLIKEVASSKKIKCYGQVSSTFCHDFVKNLRKQFSAESIRFVREIAKSSLDPVVPKMVSDAFMVRHLNCFCIPMFWTYKALLPAIHKKKILILLRAKFLCLENGKYTQFREKLLFFAPHLMRKKNEPLFVEKSIEDIDRRSPSIVFEGFVVCPPHAEHFIENEWLKMIRAHSVEEIILAGAADHRQYPNEALDKFFHDPEYQQYKKLALDNGCSFKNQSLFFIKHVFASFCNNFRLN